RVISRLFTIWSKLEQRRHNAGHYKWRTNARRDKLSPLVPSAGSAARTDQPVPIIFSNQQLQGAGAAIDDLPLFRGHPHFADNVGCLPVNDEHMMARRPLRLHSCLINTYFSLDFDIQL